ncbi:Tautomerase enzyme [Polaromonas sp.]|uniref:Tautomerase enzyme n=1 Tax=Polaromonas sp. TaxID=1869339 RepID=UPI00352A46E9
MPMLDITIPVDALSPQAETALMVQLTDLLLTHEGVDPKNPTARLLAKVFLHRPARVFVAGQQATDPHYRVVASVPEGQYDVARRSAMVAAVTNAVMDAEEGVRPRDPMRVWVFANEIPEGTWGGDGKIQGLADITGFVLGDAEKGRKYAERRLATRDKQGISKSSS